MITSRSSTSVTASLLSVIIALAVAGCATYTTPGGGVNIANLAKADVDIGALLKVGFNIENTDIGPLAVISLGFLPNKKARVRSTASAAIFDVRTGFLYGVAEATATEQQRATIWSTSSAIDNAFTEACR